MEERMKKFDLYTIIHKAQRVHMFNLSSKIGRLDLSDCESLQEVEQELKSFIKHIREHGHNEDTFIHPLFREVGSDATTLDEEHHDLDQELDKLEKVLEEKQWEELYPAFNRFCAIYLLHQDEEEQLQKTILWTHFANDRLLGAFLAFKASRSPAQHKEDLKFILPALSIPELAAIFQST